MQIKRDEVRPGDVIEVTERLTVKTVDASSVTYEEHPYRTFSFIPESRINLIERKFELPTRTGAVVKVNSESHWFLSASRPFGDMRWTSATGNVFTPDEFREFLIKYRFFIEVIA